MEELLNKYHKHFLYLKGCNHMDTLFVVFNCRGVKLGEFTYYKTMKSLGVNALLISSPSTIYFHDGIPGLGDNLEKSLSKLSDLLNKFIEINQIQNLILFGSSMGAYASICFSHFLKNFNRSIKISLILFGFELKLFSKFGRSIIQPTKETLMKFKEICPPKYCDISNLEIFFDEAFITFAEDDPVDAYSALLFKENNLQKKISLFSIKNSSHAVVESLTKWPNGLIEFIQDCINYIKNGSDALPQLFNQGKIEQYINSKDLFPLIYQDQDKNTYKEALINCISKYKEFFYALNRLGTIYEKERNYKEAYTTFRKCLLLNHSHENSQIHFKYIQQILNSKQKKGGKSYQINNVQNLKLMLTKKLKKLFLYI